MIERLPEEVVNRIAAGEVVQRHASVVKELLENSLDAGATEIRVTFETVTKLVVHDNGKGILKTDLPMAAVRHATSKLKSVNDFETLQTFGFRGEALASVSMVGRLSITSRVEDSPVGYTLAYQDTKAVNQPRPTARQVGTTVTVQDLFYNTPHKRKLRFADEYNRVLEVVQRYACLYSDVKLSCQKKTVDFITNPSQDKTESTRNVMALIYGRDILSHMVSLEGSHDNASVMGQMAKPTYAAKKTQLVLFVNRRLVESMPIQRQIEQVYGGKFVAFLSLTVPQHEVDVNVHPSKQQVVLLHQDEIVKFIGSTIRSALSEAGHSFVVNPYQKEKENKVQNAEIPNKEEKKVEKKRKSIEIVEDVPTQREPRRSSVDPSRKIRTSSTPTGAIEPFLIRKNECPLHSNGSVDLAVPGAFATASSQCTCVSVEVRTPRQVVNRPKKITPTPCTYSSILSLRKRVEKKADDVVLKHLRGASLLGLASRYRSLLQCGDSLYLFNHYQASIDLFYQLALSQFSGLRQAKLGEGGSDAVDIQQIVAHSVQFEEHLQQIDGAEDAPDSLTIEEANATLGEQVASCLFDHADMLQEYFSISVEKDDTGRILLTGLPVLLDGYSPEPHALPVFLLRLATEVEWDEEKPCFQGICREIGHFYAQLPGEEAEVSYFVRHSLFPALSSILVPSTNFVKGNHFTLLTNLTKLYKIFERC